MDGGRRGPPSRSPRAASPREIDLLAGIPLSFEANRGQLAEGTAYAARGDGWCASLAPGGASFDLGRGSAAPVTMRLRGARPATWLEGTDPLAGRSNFFLGNDPSKWVTDVPHFASLRAAEALPGVDLRWRGLPRGGLRYDFELAAGVDPASVVLDIEGAEGVAVDRVGDLVLTAPAGTLRHSRPLAWQEREGRREPLACRFAVEGSAVRFALGRHDPSLPVVIDPTVQVSTIFGAGNVARSHGCAVDAGGNVYVSGFTNVDGLATGGAYQGSRGGSDDIFVIKFPPGGSSFSYCTYLGGSSDDRYACIALDETGAVYLTGQSYSTNFPLKNSVQGFGGFRDAVVARIGPTGGTLDYSTYFGGTGLEQGYGIAVDRSGNAWVAGITTSTDLTLKSALDSTSQNGEGFLARFGPTGDLLVSTYFGGSGAESLTGVAVADDGTVWAAGLTTSSDLQKAYAVQETYGGGGEDALLVAVSATGSSLLYSSYLGGTGTDEAAGVAVDLDGDVVVTGYTTSSDFPTAAAMQSSSGGGADCFVYKLAAASKTTAFSTYLGGSSADYGFAVATDAEGDVLVTGTTDSSDFPLTSATDGTRGGASDMFLTKLKKDGSSRLFSTYHGGALGDLPRALACDGSVAALAGETTSTDYPSVNGRGESWSGQFDGAMAVFEFLPAPFRSLHTTSVVPTQVDLAWTDPHAGTYAAEVQRRTGHGSFSTVGTSVAGSTTYSDATVVEGVIYQYRVRGTSGGGNTGWSNLVRVPVPMTPPGSFQAVASANDVVDLTWTDLSPVEAGYDVLRRDVAAGPDFTVLSQRPAGSTSWSDTSAVPETAYEYKVRARSSSGVTTDSPTLAVTTPPRDLADFTAYTVDDAKVQMTWVDESDAEDGVQVQRRDDEGGGGFLTIQTTSADAVDYADTGVASEHAYTWRARAVNANGGSHWTPEISLESPPAAPSGLSAEALSSEVVHLTWTDNSAAESLFRVERKGPEDASFQVVSQPAEDSVAFEDAGLLQKAGYRYRVRAVNANGVSRALDTVTVTMPAELVLHKARRKAARRNHPAEISLSGRFDPGEQLPDFSAGVVLRIGGTEIEIPVLVESKGSLRYQDVSVRLALKPSNSGGSSWEVTLVVQGAAAEALAEDGELTFSLAAGEFTCFGSARLCGGQFNPGKGLGVRLSPSLTVESFKASIARPAAHVMALKAAFAPMETPLEEVPDIHLELGEFVTADFDGALFTEKGGKWLLKVRAVPSWNVVLNPEKGTLTIKGKGLDLGEFGKGAAPLRIELSVGELQFVDTPVLYSTGNALRF